MSGDYVWANGRLNYAQSGQWGYFRVLPAGDQRILPLKGRAAGVKRAEAAKPATGQVRPVVLK